MKNETESLHQKIQQKNTGDGMDSQQKNPEPASPVYTVVRSQIEHLDLMLSQRITYFIIAQSFFFSAFAIAITGKASDPSNNDLYKMLLLILPITSLFTIIFTSVDAVASIFYMKGLRRHYEKTTKNIQYEKAYPPIHGTVKQRVYEHFSPIILPLLFVVIWTILLVKVIEAKNHPAPPQQSQQTQQPS